MCFTIIAVGNGGYNIATDIIHEGPFEDIQFIVCDTDADDLKKHSQNACKGYLLERIQGEATSSDLALVSDVIKHTCDTIIVCSSLGGMSGSKYAPLIALEAILNGKFVASFYATPFAFEGERKNDQAITAALQIAASSNISVCQNNERLKEAGDFGLNDMYKPLLDSLNVIMKDHSLLELATSNDDKAIQALLPQEYIIAGMPLIKFRSDAYRGIDPEKRKLVFDAKD